MFEVCADCSWLISRTGLKLSVKSLYMDMAVKIQDPRHPPKKQGLRGKLQKSKFRREKKFRQNTCLLALNSWTRSIDLHPPPITTYHWAQVAKIVNYLLPPNSTLSLPPFPLTLRLSLATLKHPLHLLLPAKLSIATYLIVFCQAQFQLTVKFSQIELR